MAGEAIDSVWSAARVALLRLHHALGLSAALSAELIGAVSRNAVISKRRRLGLVGANPLRAARCEAGPSGRPPLFPRVWRPAGSQGVVSREPLPGMHTPLPLDADPKSLAQRGEHECAWPLGPAEAPGDYRTLFCCAPTQPGRSFCAVHHARAYCAPDETIEELAGCPS
jgi:hypothetical protein